MIYKLGATKNISLCLIFFILLDLLSRARARTNYIVKGTYGSRRCVIASGVMKWMGITAVLHTVRTV